jgi:hypothetical protein
MDQCCTGDGLNWNTYWGILKRVQGPKAKVWGKVCIIKEDIIRERERWWGKREGKGYQKCRRFIGFERVAGIREKDKNIKNIKN